MPVSSVKGMLKRATREQLPACVVGAPTVRVLSLFASLREAMELPQRPLLVLLSDYPAPSPVADYVWPPQPDTLVHNLDSALAMRAQWRAVVEHRVHGASLSELERLEALQQQTQRELDLLKSTVVNNVAHELRTPLMQIKNAVTFLRDPDYADKYEDLYDYADKATARLEGQINNITLLAGAFGSIEFSEVLLTDALDQALRNLGRAWAHRTNMSRVILADHPPLPLVRCNRRAIAIVLQLLIDNALKFSDDEVEVAFEAGRTHVQVAVRDRGIGIPADEHEKIFEPFYQLGQSASSKHVGMGIGLAIARQIVERHGGRIILHSVPHAGSEFLFSLPQCEG
jgi:signal transduction histidine kinase